MPHQTANIFRGANSATLVLLGGLLLSVAAAGFVANQVERVAATRFEHIVVDANDDVESRLRAYADMLLGIRALFIASETVTRGEFRSYVASLDLAHRHPGLQVIHYARRVTAAERQDFEKRVRNDVSADPDGYRDFAIKPPGERAEYFIVEYVEPMAGNEQALGLDLAGDPVRLAALDRSRDSGNLTASGGIALALDPRRHPGFALRLPVYRKGMPTATVEQRRAACAGMVSASFVVIDLMRGILNRPLLQSVRLRIFDRGFAAGSGASLAELLFDSDRLLQLEAGTGAPPDSGMTRMVQNRTFEIGGRRWELHYSARDGFIERSTRLLPWATLVAGAIISALLFGLIRSLATSGRRAVELADRITLDLRRSEASLLEAQRMTQQLIEALPNPIFFKGTDGRYLGVNRAWESLFGVARETFIGKTVHDLYPHQPAVASRLHELDQELWDRQGTQTFEESITTPDGRRHDTIYCKATFTRADGSVAGLIGTIIDITERKRLERQFQETFEQVAVGIAHFDLQHRNIRVNRRYSEIVGYSPEELLGKAPGFLNHPDDRTMGSEQRDLLLSGAIEHYAQERRYVRKDGRVVWVNRTESLARDTADAPQYFIRVIEDITDRKEAAERYRATFDNAPVGIMHTDMAEDRILHVNHKLCDMLGYSREELLRMTTDEILQPFNAGTDRPRYREQILRGEIDVYSSERALLRKDRTTVWVNRTVSLVRDAAGNPLYFIRVVEDISVRKQAESRQAMEHAITRVLAEADTLAEAVPSIIQTICTTLGWHCGARWNWDRDARLLRCCECWGLDRPEIREFLAAISGHTMTAQQGSDAGLVRQAYATGKPIWIADLSRARSFTRAALVARADLHGAFCFPLLAGNEVLGVMEFFHRDVRDPDDMLIQNARSIGIQIGQYIVRQEAEERARHLAHFDELTGLPNRAMFHSRLSHALAQARRSQQLLAVLFIDLDRFKNINDTLGHEAGDRVLEEAAHRVRGCLRESDTVARLGGDEFVVLMEEPPRPLDAAAVARKILVAVGQPFVVQEQEFHITASIGISSYPEDGADTQTLLKTADIAMYRAKEQGKNNFQFYSERINVHSIERLTLESGLRRALDRDELLLHYQPKLDLRTGRITGVEALLRWQHPAHGLLPPGRFIQLAEETGLIVAIGDWVLRTGCDRIKAWQSQPGCAGIRLAINLSPRQFGHERLLEDVTRAFGNTGLDPALVEFEITESVVMQNPEQAVRMMKSLKALGIQLSIDDFGTGYSSLNHLKRFPLDTLKIDRTFIRDIPDDADDATITQAIIAMAHSLRLRVVAEGVETPEQLNFLRAHGCDEIQGYYFSRPQPESDVLAMLQNNFVPARIHSLR